MEKIPSLSKNKIKEIKEVCKALKLKIPKYYFDLIDVNDPKDPLWKMSVPSIKELKIKKGELHDPIGDTNEELDNQPLQAITHRYPDRVLIYPTPRCGGYCRYCFRRRLAGKSEFELTEGQLNAAFEYIRNHNEIHEVILTGGDPLMLTDDKLLFILDNIKAIKHIHTIRIHTRMPVWNPYRITKELADKLQEYKPLWIVTHFNHPKELSDDAIKHTQYLINNGIMVLNQAVLLKGVNDSYEVQKELYTKMIRSMIKPYYLHQLDKAKGTSHFRVGIRKGLNILRELRGTIPGYAIPHYILDIPGGYGKIPMQYHYLNSNEEGEIVVETPEGNFQMYEDGVNDNIHTKSADNLDNIKPLEFYPEDIKEGE